MKSQTTNAWALHYSLKNKPVIEREPGACRHRWAIDIPNGPTSRGVCRDCGEEREFLNHLEEAWS